MQQYFKQYYSSLLCILLSQPVTELYIAGSSKGKKESRPSRSGKEGADNDDESPSHKIAPIINKLNENRSKLMTMFAELDKYKCGKVKYYIFQAEYYYFLPCS